MRIALCLIALFAAPCWAQKSYPGCKPPSWGSWGKTTCAAKVLESKSIDTAGYDLRLEMPDHRIIDVECVPRRGDCLGPPGGSEVSVRFQENSKRVEVTWTTSEHKVKSISKTGAELVTLKETYEVVRAADATP